MASLKTTDQILEEILSKVKGNGNVTLQLEQEVWDQGDKISKPHEVVYPAQYLQIEITNLVALGYTVTFISQVKDSKPEPAAEKKDLEFKRKAL